MRAYELRTRDCTTSGIGSHRTSRGAQTEGVRRVNVCAQHIVGKEAGRNGIGFPIAQRDLFEGRIAERRALAIASSNGAPLTGPNGDAAMVATMAASAC
jgi:hypothetical protein